MINNWAVTAGRSRLQEYAGGLKTYIPSSFACLCGSFGASDVRVNRSGDGERTLEPCCGSLEVDSGVSRALVKTLNGRVRMNGNLQVLLVLSTCTQPDYMYLLVIRNSQHAIESVIYDTLVTPH